MKLWTGLLAMNGKVLMCEADGCLFTNHKPQDYNFFKWITQHLQVKRFSASNFAIIAWRFASSAFFLFFFWPKYKKTSSCTVIWDRWRLTLWLIWRQVEFSVDRIGYKFCSYIIEWMVKQDRRSINSQTWEKLWLHLSTDFTDRGEVMALLT